MQLKERNGFHCEMWSISNPHYAAGNIIEAEPCIYVLGFAAPIT